MNTRDLNVKDVLHVGEGSEARRVVIAGNDADGIDVIWYTDGVIHYGRLPHASTYQRLYEDETIGKRASYWDFHPDMKA